jgi:hypothetical protein
LSDVAKRSSDEGGRYFQVGKEFGRHETINHSADEYVRGDAHTNKIEGYFATLKRGIIGIYHRVSQQHLVDPHRWCAGTAKSLDLICG